MLGFLIESLFFANIWIYLYNFLVQHLRLIYPPLPKDNFLILGVAPEPFEIPLYLILTFAVVLVIYIFHLKIKAGATKIKPLVKKIIFIFSTFIFLKNLGAYPLQEISLSTANLVFLAFYLMLLIFLITESAIIERLNFKFNRLMVYFLVALLIALLTFPPRFTISGVDYSYFFGPIWEVAHGKTIYNEVTSQYGFLSILFFSIFKALNLFSLPSLPVFIWILLIIQYLIYFHLIHKQSNSLTFGFLGLFSIMTINFFTVRVIPTDYPQSGPLRWFPLILPLFLLSRTKNFFSLALILVISVSSFWMIDSGIELLLAYIFTALILYMTNRVKLKTILRSFLALVLCLACFFAILNLAHLNLGLKSINLALVFNKLQQYANAGFGMLPMPDKTHFWLFILVYFASVIYFFINQLSPLGKISRKKVGVTSEVTLREADLRSEGKSLAAEKGSRVTESTFFENTILLFSANLMLFASIYYVGRSHPAELYTVSPFFLLTAFLLLAAILKKHLTSNYRVLTTITIFILFIAFPAWQRLDSLTKSIIIRYERFKKGNIFTPELNGLLIKKYGNEIKLIRQEMPEEEIIIVSGDDTYLYYLSNKYSLLADNSLITILTKQDLAHSLKKAGQTCPKKIAGECRLFRSCPNTGLFSQAFSTWQPIVLSELEKSCQVKYQPTECTDQLCIAEANSLL